MFHFIKFVIMIILDSQNIKSRLKCKYSEATTRIYHRTCNQWRTLEKRFRRWGVQGYGRPRRGSGAENFSKFGKKSLKKIANIHYFRVVFKRKHNIGWGQFAKTLKFFDGNSI